MLRVAFEFGEKHGGGQRNRCRKSSLPSKNGQEVFAQGTNSMDAILHYKPQQIVVYAAPKSIPDNSIEKAKSALSAASLTYVMEFWIIYYNPGGGIHCKSYTLSLKLSNLRNCCCGANCNWQHFLYLQKNHRERHTSHWFSHWEREEWTIYD